VTIDRVTIDHVTIDHVECCCVADGFMVEVFGAVRIYRV
jgi:hypothetical protein